MKRVFAIGELLIDFVCSDVNTSLSDGMNFIKKPGGAPANVCAVIAKLGGKSSFIGKVGNDPFGRYLAEVLEEYGVDTSHCSTDSDISTTLAFVSLMSHGERDFCFNRGADERLRVSDIDSSIFSKESIIHFGSATGFLGGDLTDAYTHALKKAKDSGMFVSFDPNYRLDLWKGREDEFIQIIRENLHFADLVKFSDEELFLISKIASVKAAVKLVHDMGVPFVAVTLGKDGAIFSSKDYYLHVPSIDVASIDSTGAGDAFVGALLAALANTDNCRSLLTDRETAGDIVFRANAAAALVCTQYGAISAIPDKKDIEKALQQTPIN